MGLNKIAKKRFDDIDTVANADPLHMLLSDYIIERASELSEDELSGSMSIVGLIDKVISHLMVEVTRVPSPACPTKYYDSIKTRVVLTSDPKTETKLYYIGFVKTTFIEDPYTTYYAKEPRIPKIHSYISRTSTVQHFFLTSSTIAVMSEEPLQRQADFLAGIFISQFEKEPMSAYRDKLDSYLSGNSQT